MITIISQNNPENQQTSIHKLHFAWRHRQVPQQMRFQNNKTPMKTFAPHNQSKFYPTKPITMSSSTKQTIRQGNYFHAPQPHWANKWQLHCISEKIQNIDLEAISHQLAAVNTEDDCQIETDVKREETPDFQL